jgi:phospholipid/cholesterol/gamma-HCH transport system permease protein
VLQAASASVGETALAFLSTTGRVLRFSSLAIVGALSTTEGRRASAFHALTLMKRCLVPVVLVVGPVGGMLAMQSLALTRTFGVERLLAPLIAATVIRELSPGFSSVMVCFQAGAGIAAELGTMKVREEIDALEVMGLDARAMLAGPRIIGAALCAPILNAVGIFVGIFMAWLVAVGLFGLPHGVFMSTVWGGITPTDLWLSEGKCLLFGVLLGSVSASFGFDTKGGAAGVGRAANRTVVATVILVLVTNYLLNTAVLGLRGGGVL